MWPFRKKDQPTKAGPAVFAKRAGRVVSVRRGARTRVAIETIGGDVDYYMVVATELAPGDEVLEGGAV